MNKIKTLLEDEAMAFDKRISERDKNGFIPDLQNAVSCEYFYKSFWREPKYINLYLGNILKIIFELFETHASKHLNILDVGCGHGLMSLELARKGYNVDAFDISKKNIELANRTLNNSRKDEKFGSLTYKVKAFQDIDIKKKYDIVFFCGSLHHMQDLSASIRQAHSLLTPNGILYCHEPIHKNFTLADASQVALIRTLLSQTGYWYEDSLTHFDKKSLTEFQEYTTHIHTEYVLERDIDEIDGQSPSDLETDGEEILNTISQYFTKLEYQPSASFIYRVLGGLRGDSNTIHDIANFLATYDKFMTKQGFLNPNYFHYIGKKY